MQWVAVALALQRCRSTPSALQSAAEQLVKVSKGAVQQQLWALRAKQGGLLRCFPAHWPPLRSPRPVAGPLPPPKPRTGGLLLCWWTIRGACVCCAVWRKECGVMGVWRCARMAACTRTLAVMLPLQPVLLLLQWWALAW